MLAPRKEKALELLQKAQAHQTVLKAPTLLLATWHFTVFRTWYMEWMKYFVTLVILLLGVYCRIEAKWMMGKISLLLS